MLPSTYVADVEKSIRYAKEREQRIVFNRFSVTVEGDHRDHIVGYDQGHWTCDCEGFVHHGHCPHTMTMERVLGDTVTMGEIAAPVA